MIRTTSLLGACAVVVALLASPPPVLSQSTPPGYALVWSDEFAQSGWPDPRNWTYERGFVRNQELQWYQADNAEIRNGFLIIEARKESKPNPGFDRTSADWRLNRPTAEYTSASLTTRGLHSFRYGRFEMRAKIDVRAGMWPAFWTVGDAGRWPASGEIDVMEYYAGNLLANVAWGSDTPGKAVWDDSRKPIVELGADWSQRFHVWRMDWDENAIRIYVDDMLLKETDLHKTVNGDGAQRNPLQQAHHIILNLAIGGANGGDPAATKFPARLEIDYVRVYQRTPPGPGGP